MEKLRGHQRAALPAGYEIVEAGPFQDGDYEWDFSRNQWDTLEIRVGMDAPGEIAVTWGVCRKKK